MSWEKEFTKTLNTTMLDVDELDRVILETFITSLLKKQREILAERFGKECPNCDNVGYIVVNFRTDKRIQCEYCYAVEGSKFNYLNAPEPK